MDMNTVLTITLILFIIIGSLLLIHLIDYISHRTRLIKLQQTEVTQNISSELLKDVVKKAVIFTNIHYVEDLKQQKEFTPACQKYAMKQTLSLIKSTANPIMFIPQGTTITNFDKWLELLVESAIVEVKQN